MHASLKMLFNVKFFKLSVTNWFFNKNDNLINVPGLCSMISTEDKILPSNKPLIIEFNRGFKTFVVSKNI